MNRPIITVPYAIMRASRIDWDIDWRGQPGNDRTDGSTQVVFDAFPRWIGTLDLVLARDLARQFRAMRWQAQGRVGIYRLYMVDPMGFNLQAAVGGEAIAAGVPFSSGARFSTGQGFHPSTVVLTSAAAEAGASEVQVTTADPTLVPVPGQIMSAGDWPFAVTAVSENGGNIYTLSVQMPLREEIASGAMVNCVASGLFEVSDDLAGALSYDTTLVGRSSISFREVLNR